jgi:hypothetical protein
MQCIPSCVGRHPVNFALHLSCLHTHATNIGLPTQQHHDRHTGVLGHPRPGRAPAVLAALPRHRFRGQASVATTTFSDTGVQRLNIHRVWQSRDCGWCSCAGAQFVTQARLQSHNLICAMHRMRSCCRDHAIERCCAHSAPIHFSHSAAPLLLRCCAASPPPHHPLASDSTHAATRPPTTALTGSTSNTRWACPSPTFHTT